MQSIRSYGAHLPVHRDKETSAKVAGSCRRTINWNMLKTCGNSPQNERVPVQEKAGSKNVDVVSGFQITFQDIHTPIVTVVHA